MRVLLLSTLLAIAPASAQAQPLPELRTHENRTAAGTLRAGVLTLDLRVVRGVWRPDRADDPGLSMIGFGVAGQPASIPGPLIRVPAGTIVRSTVRNETDSAIVVRGLSGTRASTDTAFIAPRATRALSITADQPGTFIYVGAFANRSATTPPRFGEDRMLSGAFIVDEPGPRRPDRVLVLSQLVDDQRIPGSATEGSEALAINGKSWPHTERFSHTVGDTVRWRVINASYDVHPMHLHGFYFTVHAKGTLDRDSVFAADQGRLAVTERMNAMTTMRMEWVPERPGNWLFHCHLNFHIQPHGPFEPAKAAQPHSHDENHALTGMAGLVMGISVRERRPSTTRTEPARRQLRLFVLQGDSIPGDYVPRFGFALQEPGKPAPTRADLRIPGPPLILRRGEPTAITVHNRLSASTAVHWHGVELESYYDGVAGFGGLPSRVTPAIAAGDSFVVRVTPPRAGTFIYHSHFDEIRQQGGGMYGAFIVLEPNETFNPALDIPVIFSTEPRGDTRPMINGDTAATLTLRAGQTYRLRFINITLDRAALVATLLNGSALEQWQVVAKDGATLPAAQVRTTPSRLLPSIGETYDILYTPATPGDRLLELRTGAGVLLRTARIEVRPSN